MALPPPATNALPQHNNQRGAAAAGQATGAGRKTTRKSAAAKTGTTEKLDAGAPGGGDNRPADAARGKAGAGKKAAGAGRAVTRRNADEAHELAAPTGAAGAGNCDSFTAFYCCLLLRVLLRKARHLGNFFRSCCPPAIPNHRMPLKFVAALLLPAAAGGTQTEVFFSTTDAAFSIDLALLPPSNALDQQQLQQQQPNSAAAGTDDVHLATAAGAAAAALPDTQTSVPSPGAAVGLPRMGMFSWLEGVTVDDLQATQEGVEEPKVAMASKKSSQQAAEEAPLTRKEVSCCREEQSSQVKPNTRTTRRAEPCFIAR